MAVGFRVVAHREPAAVIPMWQREEGGKRLARSAPWKQPVSDRFSSLPFSIPLFSAVTSHRGLTRTKHRAGAKFTATSVRLPATASSPSLGFFYFLRFPAFTSSGIEFQTSS